MLWYEWIISILLFIISLGALICIHEAGHLSMAKLFKVYCREYSIGFGPAILHKRKEGKETYFSIRVIPFGGYVAMYGEEGDGVVEENENIPPERSIEGVKKWKKAIIVSAGVILNAVLALILIGISDIAFPSIAFTRNASVEESSLIVEKGVKENDQLEFIYPESSLKDDMISPFEYKILEDEKVTRAGSFFIIDTNSTLKDGDHCVLTFSPNGNKNNPNFADCVNAYKAVSKTELESKTHSKELFGEWAATESSPEYYPNIDEGLVALDEKSVILTNLCFKKAENEETFDVALELKTVQSGKGYKIEDIGLSFKTDKYWLPFGQRVKNTFIDYGNASVTVFRGIGELFRSGVRNMSGIVGIFETSAQLYSNYTFATYLYFWGLISVNLAIFNLLPFPGLDGWQLLVTAIEGITKKKLPKKFKTIMSMIGLGLLFALMIAVIVMDILRIGGALL